MVLYVRHADNVYKTIDWFIYLSGRGATIMHIMHIMLKVVAPLPDRLINQSNAL
jgi:hypothetical protein